MNASLHNTGRLPCQEESLPRIEAPWRGVLEVMWLNGPETVASCAGHEGKKGNVFLKWDAAEGDETLLSFFSGLLVERRVDLGLDWQLMSQFGTNHSHWVLEAPCPVDTGWDEATLRLVERDLAFMARELATEFRYE